MTKYEVDATMLCRRTWDKSLIKMGENNNERENKDLPFTDEKEVKGNG